MCEFLTKLLNIDLRHDGKMIFNSIPVTVKIPFA